MTQTTPPTESPVSASQPKLPFEARKQPQPGLESELQPQPHFEGAQYRPAGKLIGKVAIVTGGDSGIGRAVAVFYAREGADVLITYLPEEQQDADVTRQAVQAAGRRCEQLAGNLCDSNFCKQVIQHALSTLGAVNILVSNAAYQHRKASLEEITDEEWDHTFQTNVYAMFRVIKSALPHMKAGSAIIVTSSETGLFGSPQLLDYSSTKGAINAFVKSLANNVLPRGIRVNAVAPGPVWTPLNPADPGLSSERVAEFGGKTPMKRPAQPEEIAPAYVFLASDADSSFITGHVLPILGGKTTTG